MEDQGDLMAEFTVHDENSAAAEAKPALAQAKKHLGFIPHLYGVLAESPQAFAAYQALSDQLRKSSLSIPAQQVVLLTASRHNGCAYCVAVHSTLAAASKVDAAVIEAVRDDKPIDDPKLEAVRRFTGLVVDTRGWVPDDDVQAFLGAGFTRRQVLDILTGVAMKTLSNYTNHLAHTALDDAFTAYAWRPNP
jgi:uncharacterized peroxidase-related enzyme